MRDRVPGLTYGGTTMSITSEGHCSRSARWMIGVAASVMAIGGLPALANAQSNAITIEISAQRLDRALLQLSRQADVDITAPGELTRGRAAPAVRGSLTIEDALSRLLAGSGLTARRTGDRTYSIARANTSAELVSPAEIGEGGGSSEAITVTGTRIRGAPPAAPVITITSEDIRNAGQSDLGEVVRSLPQNFGGGTNPAIISGAEQFGQQRGNGTSALNLRGLGPAATLTLLNGRRLAYDVVNNAVDISAIPLAAVERIEIVADGASALYGSDAVGGVANVIIRDNFDGLSLTGRAGSSTEGGYSSRLLSATAGHTWRSGRILVGGDFRQTSEIFAGQRPYSSGLHPTAPLYPFLRNWSGIASGRQEIVADLILRVDGLYSRRRYDLTIPTTLLRDYLGQGVADSALTEMVLIAPTLDVRLPNDWRASFGASYSRELSIADRTNFSNGAATAFSSTRFRNIAQVVEATAEGPVALWPGNPIRAAVGVGYRRVGLLRVPSVNGVETARGSWSRDAYFAYGELFVPLVDSDQGVRGVHRLSFNGSLRYENYIDDTEVVTPKIGVIYAPLEGLTLSATWGRSFKTPTLFELNRDRQTIANNPAAYGGTGFPPNSTVLLLAGGNDELRPERSTNWTATIAVHPAALHGARIEVSYYDVRYTDRILSPISPTNQALTNPIFAPFVNLSPSAAEIAAAVASATVPINNLTGRPFDPSTVVAIASNRLTNVTREDAHGVDVRARYAHSLGSSSELAASANVTYLRLRRQLLFDLPMVEETGQIFRPSRWRGRGGVTFAGGAFVASAHANYIGPLTDTRPIAVVPRLDAQWTFDASAIYRIETPRYLDGLEFQVSANNILNATPQPLPTPTATSASYDFTNYSALGRVVSFAITARW